MPYQAMKKITLKITLCLITFMANYGANTFSVLGMYQPKKPNYMKK